LHFFGDASFFNFEVYHFQHIYFIAVHSIIMYARYTKHTLQFSRPSGTSRGVLKTKDSWYLILKSSLDDIKYGIGECSIIEGLNPENSSELDKKFDKLCQIINESDSVSNDFFSHHPSVRFAYEMAMRDLDTGGAKILYDNNFVKGKGIPINGLIWMGTKEYMIEQVSAKLDQGYQCLKLKVAAIDFGQELDILKSIRDTYSKDDLEIRLDANGGWSPQDAVDKLNQLSEYSIHSIEQPIRQGQWEEMAKIVTQSQIPVALDEELIGVENSEKREELLDLISPDYIILKPSLLGGFSASDEWIQLANDRNIKWWITSALESNIGLNAIAQWTASLDNTMYYQGLGTGQLFDNNIPSPLQIRDAHLQYVEAIDWQLDFIAP